MYTVFTKCVHLWSLGLHNPSPVMQYGHIPAAAKTTPAAMETTHKSDGPAKSPFSRFQPIINPKTLDLKQFCQFIGYG